MLESRICLTVKQTNVAMNIWIFMKLLITFIKNKLQFALFVGRPNSYLQKKYMHTMTHDDELCISRLRMCCATICSRTQLTKDLKIFSLHFGIIYTNMNDSICTLIFYTIIKLSIFENVCSFYIVLKSKSIVKCVH